MKNSSFHFAQVYDNKLGVYVDYYAADPATGRMIRFRTKFNRERTKRQKLEMAKRFANDVNDRLYSGWNPLLTQEEAVAFRPLNEAMDHYIRHVERQVQDKTVRPDTLRAYTSFVVNLKAWLGKSNPLCYEWDKAYISRFLDYIYLEKKNSARTRNNYLSFLRRLGSFMVENSYCSVNPAEGIRSIRESQKVRTELSKEALQALFAYLSTPLHANYNALAQTVYYCLVRRTEITFLKVSDFDLDKQELVIRAEFSKNGKTQSVSIPQPLLPLLKKHFVGASPESYAFSANDFKPGKRKLAPKKISDTWTQVKKALGFPAHYQFYSLKDTGITHMLQSGISPLAVRDQARHYDLSMTDKYVRSGVSVGNPEILAFGTTQDPRQ
jgi:integrase